MDHLYPLPLSAAGGGLQILQVWRPRVPVGVEMLLVSVRLLAPDSSTHTHTHFIEFVP